MDFLLFLLVNATLFLRPSELFPGLAEVQIYLFLILVSLIVALPKLVVRLRPASLAREPVTLCVLALLPATFLSHLSHFDLWRARYDTLDFSKTIIYFLVLIAVVDSMPRLRTFLYSIALFTAVSATVAILHYYEIIEVPSLTVLNRTELFDSETGAEITFRQLQATGIFADPNDLSAIVVVAICASLYGLGDKSRGMIRLAWLVPLAVLFLTLGLTRSRGGLLGCIVALGTLSCFRYGFWKTALAGALLLPAVFALGSQQTNIGEGMSGGTGQQRVEFWRDGFQALKASPVFGVGSNEYQEYTEGHHVAHNSFIHAFVELGLVGGAFFFGAFWFSGVSLWKLRKRLSAGFRDLGGGALWRLHPYLLAIVAGYGVSQMGISRAYVVPTYLVLGGASACSFEARREGLPALLTVNPRLLRNLAAASVLFVAGMYLFIRFSPR